jgi:hypothetical protein
MLGIARRRVGAHVLGMIMAEAGWRFMARVDLRPRGVEGGRGSMGIASCGGDHFLPLTPEVDCISPLDIVLVKPPM